MPSQGHHGRRTWHEGHKTKRAANAILRKLMVGVDEGTYVPTSTQALGEYLDRWLIHMEDRVRPQTHARYGQLLRVHVKPRIGSVRLRDLRPLHVQRVVDEMRTDGLAPRTAVHAYRVLSSALKQAVRWQVIAANPAAGAKPPSTRGERSRALSVPDAATVRRILDGSCGTVHYIPLLLAATAGLRRGEVLGLTWEDIDLERGRVTVRRSVILRDRKPEIAEPKTPRARRQVELPPSTVAALRAYHVEQTKRRLALGSEWDDLGLVCDRGNGGMIHPDLYSQYVKRLTERLGVPGVRLHDLRHAFATRLLEAGVHPKVVSEALGHASVAFTMDVYQHVLEPMHGQVGAAIEAAYSPSPAIR